MSIQQWWNGNDRGENLYFGSFSCFFFFFFFFFLNSSSHTNIGALVPPLSRIIYKVFHHYFFYTCVELFHVYIETSASYYLRPHTKQLILFPLEISPLHIIVVCMLSFRYIIFSCNLVTVYYVCLHTCRWCSPAGTHSI